MIALWHLPILIVLEHNQIAQTTPASLAVAGSICQRFEAFGIQTAELDSSDILEILPLAEVLVNEVRSESAPRALIITTARLGAHSKSDDTRAPSELEMLWATRDPIAIQAARLKDADRTRVVDEVDLATQQAFEAALAADGGPQ